MSNTIVFNTIVGHLLNFIHLKLQCFWFRYDTCLSILHIFLRFICSKNLKYGMHIMHYITHEQHERLIPFFKIKLWCPMIMDNTQIKWTKGEDIDFSYKRTVILSFSIQSCRSCYATQHLCQRSFHKIFVKFRNSKKKMYLKLF
jgi:hypothetical protein